MIKVFQTGILPLGHFDIVDSDLANITGGEVLVFDTAPVVAGERAVPDVYQNGARSNLRLATENDVGPFFLANVDKNSGQYTTPGFEKTSAFSTNTAFANQYDSSSKVGIFYSEGFYSLSLDVFEDGYVDQNTPINSRLYVNSEGLLTTNPSNSIALVAYFIEYRQGSILNNNINRPFYTAGSFPESDSIIIYKTNSDGYVDLAEIAQQIGNLGELGTPTDGYYTDGYLSLASSTKINDAIDGLNESLEVLFSNTIRDRANVVSITSDYTLGLIDGVILADASGGAININLGAGALNRRLTVKKTDSTGFNINVLPDGLEQIENDTSLIITDPGVSLTLIFDGSNWWII